MKFEYTKVYNIEEALRGMRNPLQSWEKSDPDKDMALAEKLIAAGSEHRKFLRQILVSVDIVAPEYFWKQFDTYTAGGITKNSTSTMHTLTKLGLGEENFELQDLSQSGAGAFIFGAIKQTRSVMIGCLQKLLDLYNDKENSLTDEDRKAIWRELISLLPMGYIYRRTVTMNYENIFNMLHQRYPNHKLKEWFAFGEWAKTLPYAKEFLFKDLPY